MPTLHPRSHRLRRLLHAAPMLLLVVLLAPLALAIALSVLVTMGRPVLFRQVRPGQHGRLFTLYKFRTMTDRRSASGELLPDHRRLTTVGRFLRRTSLDELPELWNILKGEMAWIGPRPLLPHYLARYNPRPPRRHDAR